MSDEYRAIMELVKNSYDADATLCRITVDAATKSITIADDGVGMTLRQVQDGWLHVATPSKEAASTSSGGRRVSGSKGIGRWALFGLCDTATIQTKARGGKWLELEMSLHSLSDSGDIASAPAIIKKINRPNSAVKAEQGTVITLHDATVPSTDDGALFGFDELESYLRLLQAPISADHQADTADFTIELALAPAEPGPVGPWSVDTDPRITLTGLIDKEGKARFTVGYSSEHYVGGEKVKLSRKRAGSTYPNLIGVTISLNWYPLGSSPLKAAWKVPRIAAHDRRFIGVRLYRDSIRVLPYGDEGNDWLGLTAEYTKLGALKRFPKASQVDGWILATRDHKLIDVANRQGLLNNAEFRELKRFAKEAADAIADLRRDLEPATTAKRPIIEVEETFQEARRAVRQLQKYATDEESKELLSFLQQTLGAAEDEYDKLALYRERLSSGNLVRLILHDSGITLKPTQRLVRDAGESACAVDLHNKTFHNIGAMLPRLIQGYELLKGAARRGAYRKGNFVAHDVASDLAKRFEESLARNLSVNVTGYSGQVHMKEADFWALLVNLTHNAVLSAEFTHARGKLIDVDRKVAIALGRDGSDLTIQIDDNGPGLPPTDDPEWIWKQFNSTRGGGGSGLGLWIVDEICNDYGGERDAGASTKFSVGATFWIRLPGVIVQ